MSGRRIQSASPEEEAVRILLRFARRGAGFAAGLADAVSDPERGGSGPQAAIIRGLVNGVAARSAWLDRTIGLLADRGLPSIPEPLLQVLRCGLFRLIFDRQPGPPTVSRFVEAAGRLSGPKGGGFANALLRKAAGQVGPLLEEWGSAPWQLRYSIPPWLASDIERFAAEQGMAADRLAAYLDSPPPFTVRVNQLRASPESVVERFAAAGLAVRPCQLSPHGFVIDRPRGLAGLPGWNEGWWAVQDEAAQIVSLLLDPRPGERLIDLCAAPGQKAFHCLGIVSGRADLIALDRSGPRIGLLEREAVRLGASSLTVRLHDALQPLPDGLERGGFDRVLLDAPCTGLGVVRRRPDIRLAHWKGEARPALADMQRRLLDRAAGLVAPGGRLVYAVCTFTHLETDAQVGAFLERHPEFAREYPVDNRGGVWHEFLAGSGRLARQIEAGADLHFAARFRRSG